MELNLILIIKLFWFVIIGLVFFIFICIFGWLFNFLIVWIIGFIVMGIIFMGNKKVEFNLFISLELFIMIINFFVK